MAPARGGANVRLLGVEAMARKLRRLHKKFPDEALQAQVQETEFLATECVKVTPRHDGHLRDSIHVPPAEKKGNLVITKIVAGGVDASYATAVHEHPSKHDPPSWKGTTIHFKPAGTGPKFIEAPLLKAIPKLPDKIARRIDLNRALR